jgi:hypothetical protein
MKRAPLAIGHDGRARDGGRLRVVNGRARDGRLRVVDGRVRDGRLLGTQVLVLHTATTAAACAQSNAAGDTQHPTHHECNDQFHGCRGLKSKECAGLAGPIEPQSVPRGMANECSRYTHTHTHTHTHTYHGRSFIIIICGIYYLFIIIFYFVVIIYYLLLFFGILFLFYYYYLLFICYIYYLLLFFGILFFLLLFIIIFWYLLS